MSGTTGARRAATSAGELERSSDSGLGRVRRRDRRSGLRTGVQTRRLRRSKEPATYGNQGFAGRPASASCQGFATRVKPGFSEALHGAPPSSRAPHPAPLASEASNCRRTVAPSARMQPVRTHALRIPSRWRTDRRPEATSCWFSVPAKRRLSTTSEPTARTASMRGRRGSGSSAMALGPSARSRGLRRGSRGRGGGELDARRAGEVRAARGTTVRARREPR